MTILDLSVARPSSHLEVRGSRLQVGTRFGFDKKINFIDPPQWNIYSLKIQPLRAYRHANVEGL